MDDSLPLAASGRFLAGISARRATGFGRILPLARSLSSRPHSSSRASVLALTPPNHQSNQPAGKVWIRFPPGLDPWLEPILETRSMRIRGKSGACLNAIAFGAAAIGRLPFIHVPMPTRLAREESP
jgi:hypothetical protein